VNLRNVLARDRSVYGRSRPDEISRTQKRVVLAVLVGMSLLVALTACSSDDDSGDDAGADGGGGGGGDQEEVGGLLDTLAGDVIVPAYTELVERVDGLGTALDDLCAHPSPAGLDAARTAWRSAADAWQHTRPVGVGPAMDHRLMSEVGYPIRPDDVAEVLAGSAPITPEALDDTGASARGLAAVELLLFEPQASDAELAAGPANGRRCTYAAAATTLAGTASQEVLDDWTGEGAAAGEAYTETFVAGMEDGDPQSSLAAVVNEVAHALQTIDDQGLRGIAVAEGPDDVPANQRDGAAGHRVADLRALHDTVAVVIQGPNGDDGLGRLVTARSDDTGQRLDDAQAAAVATVGALPDSIPDTLAAPDDLAAASDAVAELKVVVSTEVASLLGITIGFSDADGDS
jgi:predicted lipoprotein